MPPEITQKIKSFNFPLGEYVLFGSATIIAHNLREFNHDVDILVTEKLWDLFLKNPDWTYKTFERDGRTVEELEYKDGTVELYKNWEPGVWDPAMLIKEAEIINDLPFVQLRDVLKWKLISARDKDLKDATLIEEYLKNK